MHTPDIEIKALKTKLSALMGEYNTLGPSFYQRLATFLLTISAPENILDEQRFTINRELQTKVLQYTFTFLRTNAKHSEAKKTYDLWIVE